MDVHTCLNLITKVAAKVDQHLIHHYQTAVQMAHYFTVFTVQVCKSFWQGKIFKLLYYTTIYIINCVQFICPLMLH